MTAADQNSPTGVAHLAIDAVWRIESPRLIAGLARIVRDVGIAEDLAQDALVAALEQWPEEGVPRNPGAWLMAAAKHRAIDHFRRNKLLERKHEELGYELEAQQSLAATDLDAALDDDVGDDLLSLVFTACHPVLSTEARVALTLRLLGGLTTDEIARAFLVPEPTIAQRIVRAKRTLAKERVPFEVPRGAELAARLSSVLEVIYLVFNEGYTATAGDDWMRPALCEDALRLGRILAELVPKEPEVHGLVALMEIQASRSRARVGPVGGAHPAPRSEPRALGSAPHPARSRGARSRGSTRRGTRPVRAPGRDRRLSRACARSGGNGLGAHRRALRAARHARPFTYRGAESCGRGRNGVRSPGRPRARRRADRRAVAQGVPPLARRARRLARQARPLRRGRRGVRARGIAHAKRTRARTAARSSRGVRARVGPLGYAGEVRRVNLPTLVIVHDLHIVGVPVVPDETDAVLIDANPGPGLTDSAIVPISLGWDLKSGDISRSRRLSIAAGATAQSKLFDTLLEFVHTGQMGHNGL